MYILVNNDLKMDKGKIAGQVAHSACRVDRYVSSLPSNKEHHKLYKEWINTGEAKIVLKCTEEMMLSMINKYEDIVCSTRDMGRTQIKPNSLTTIAFFPMYKKNAPKEIQDLKLL